MSEILHQVIAGTVYKHKRTGDYYEVIAIANLLATREKEQEFPVTIVYKRLYDGTIWSSPLGSFLESFDIES